MAGSINKVILVGRLGQDPKLTYLPSGSPVAELSVATDVSYKDRDGNKQDKTEWHNIVIYGKLAEIANQYLKKGRSVYIEGRIQTRKWQDKNGQERYTTEIIASAMQMLGERAESSGQPSHSESKPSAPRTDSTQQRRPSPAKPVDEFEDDIPF